MALIEDAGSARRQLMWTALLVAGFAAVTIATVWGFQHAGYTPCELCLLERDPFYVGLPLALIAALAAAAGHRGAAAWLLGLLALLFAASAVLAGYHAGVEWGFWAGPSGCSGAVPAPAGVDDFLKQLDRVKVVRCDAPALRVAGLSLAGWNVVVSLGLAALAAIGLRRAIGRSGAAANRSGSPRPPF